MEQFIQYLYEYDNGERIRNLGFMKVETKMDKSVIQIYAKQLDEIKGIWFEREDGSRYMATWKECGEDNSACDSCPLNQGEDCELRLCNEQKLECEEPPIGCGEEILDGESPIESEVEPPIEDVEIDTYTPPSSRRYEKIQRKDLSRLPRREWRLANNSFLLHGFYNYHHLLYIEEDDKIWIGVPGIFHEKEEMAANAFGFSEFMRPADMDVNLSAEEKNTYEDFGYWCRGIER